MKETAPEAERDDLPPLGGELVAADTLDQTVEILLRALEGESESSLLPHRYVTETYHVLSRELREEVDQSVLRLLEELARGADWNTEASVELLLLTRTLFRSRAAAQAALVSIARILANPENYAPETAVAAGQAAIALDYHGAPDLWYRLYEMAGDHAVPTVVGGLAKTEWKSLLDWLDDRRRDPWVERTVINQLPAFLVREGAERVRGLANRIWASTSESGQLEIRSFMKRLGVEFDPVQPASEAPEPDWPLIIRGLLTGELAMHVQEAGGVEPYVRSLFVGRSDAAPTEFRNALNDELTQWRDARLASKEFIDPMLDLIRAFRPDRGAATTVDCLERNAVILSANATLKALAALAVYYEEPPTRGTRDRLYARYLQALRTFTPHAKAGRTALGALLTLNAIDFRDLRFASMVASDEARQKQVVDFAVAADWNEKLLSWLFVSCVRGSSPQQPAIFKSFIANLRRHAGNNLSLWWQSIAIGSKTIAVPRELTKSYVLLRQAVAVPEGYEAYRQMITED